MSRQRSRGGAPRRDSSRNDVPPVRDQVVCRLERRGRLVTAVPFFERGRGEAVDNVRDAKPGDLILLQSARATRGRAKVLRVLGSPENSSVVIEALMLDRGLSRRFGPGIERAAADARDAGGPVEGVARRDLRELATFTIDPATAQDFDDAISAERLGEGSWRVWVHIADVSAFVRPGDPVDREAYRRATSVYVPGKVEPMLPEPLSNDACSLRPDVDRLAVTIEMEVRGTAVTAAEFYRSTIRSDMRLEYEQVDRIFAGTDKARAPWAEPLSAARAAAAALGERRDDEGALAIDSGEPEFDFDRKGNVVAVRRSVQTESHKLIEYLMVAANEQVAKLLAGRGTPALFRIHEKPEGSAVEQLVEKLASLGVATPPVHENMSPQDAADAVAEASRLIDQHVRRTGQGRRALTSLLLRSLKQARYEPRNLGHAGLGLTHYCHFTSPIRRYPDLICHRALLSAVGGGEQAPQAGAMEEAGTTTSARERDAMVIERKADDIARCFLLERELFSAIKAGTVADRVFDGEVVGIIATGAFVAFGDGYEGMLPVRRLRGDWWELNEEGTILFGADSGRAIRLGDPIRVAVGRIDAPQGRVDLDLAA